MIQRVLVLLTLALLPPLMTGCGKYGPPVPPEARAPKAVLQLVATPQADRVAFTWQSAEADRSGTELLSMDEYRVYQKELTPGAPAEWQKGFSLIGSVPDTHVAELAKLRAEARARGELTRRVSLDSKRSQFAFSTPPLSAGRVYLFKVVPVNQGIVEGEVRQLVRVAFQGPASVLNYISLTADDQLSPG